MHRKATNLLILLMLLLLGCAGERENSHRSIIIDDAHLLSGNPKLLQSYKEYNEQLLTDYQIDFRVVTTASDTEINTFANHAFEVFTAESGTRAGRAILMVINSKQDLVRLEVSMALEPIYTDIFTSFIEEQHMVRFFRDNRLAEGIFATTETIYNRARDAAGGQEFLGEMASRSLGGGAKSSADIGKQELNVKSTKAVSVSVDESPAQVLAKYIESRRRHNDNPNLDIFTEDTKAFFRNWTVTPVQMDNEVRFFSKCAGAETIVADDQDYAVVMFPVEQRKCSPYLLRQEQGSWKLDFATMTRLIRFNHEMKWHLILDWQGNMGKQKYALLTQKGLLPSKVRALLAPYQFAFVDYLYDRNGYPYDDWGKAVFKIAFDAYGDGQYQGTYINRLHSRGVGKRSGLKVWDQIVELDGKEIREGDLDYIAATMRSKKSGEALPITVSRRENGETVIKKIVMVVP